MNYLLGESVMIIFKNMFSQVDKFVASAFAGLVAIFAPIQTSLLALSSIIIVDSIYDYKSKRNDNVLTKLKNVGQNTFYKLRDAIVAICGAHIIEKYIVTSIDLHCVEFIAGAIALVEFWTLLENLSRIHPKWKIWSVLQRIVKKKSKEYLDVELDKEIPNR